jgi:thiamine biosynthesis lipoprotein
MIHKFSRSALKFVLPIMLSLGWAESSIAQAGNLHEYREVHLGMEVRLLLHGELNRTAEAARTAFDLVDSLDLIFSDWRAGSDLRRLEEQPVGWWVPIPAELRDVLSLALRVASATDGAFDPTVGPLSRLWREAQITGVDPTPTARASALKKVDWRNLHLDSARSRVRMAIPNMQFDLGAVAKGWILDRVLETLGSLGVGSALVEAGGDIAMSSAPPGTDGWRVVISDSVRIMHGVAVSTSGPSVQWRLDEDGTVRSHVIVTDDGRGSTDDVQLTVVARSAAVSDALATAMTLVPTSQHWQLMAEFGVRAVFRR